MSEEKKPRVKEYQKQYQKNYRKEKATDEHYPQNKEANKENNERQRKSYQELVKYEKEVLRNLRIFFVLCIVQNMTKKH